MVLHVSWKIYLLYRVCVYIAYITVISDRTCEAKTVSIKRVYMDFVRIFG